MFAGNKPVHPDISDEMWHRIDAVISGNRSKPGSIITVLRECQNIVGYLPKELMDFISREMNIPGSTVFGVATFYSLFLLKPKGRHTIKICLGTACYVKGIQEVLSRIGNSFRLEAGETTPDRRFSLELIRCLGACGLAPVMVVGQDVHGDVSADKVIDILEQYT